MLGAGCCRDGITKKDVAVYRGLLVADQNAKLAAFASRPAVLNYATNTVSTTLQHYSTVHIAQECVWFKAGFSREDKSVLHMYASNIAPAAAAAAVGLIFWRFL